MNIPQNDETYRAWERFSEELPIDYTPFRNDIHWSSVDALTPFLINSL